MNIPLISTLSLIFISLSTYSFSAQAEINDGRLLASQCAQCHGTDGYSQTDIDSLAGEDDIAEEMLEMRAETDNDDIMVKQAHGYSDTEINLIAAYFASLPSSNGNNNQEDHDSGKDEDDDDKDDDHDNSGKDEDDRDDSDKDDDNQGSSHDIDRFNIDSDQNTETETVAETEDDNVVRNIRWWLRWD
jgi:cytochrome c553